MFKRLFKKTIALVLAVITVISLLPAGTVSAATGDAGTISFAFTYDARKAYELCNSGCFKVVRIGRALRISKLSFDTWLDHMNNDGGL